MADALTEHDQRSVGISERANCYYFLQKIRREVSVPHTYGW
ncbi:hypothetical protein [Stutzerimonas stutzeri]|nr:hypothetical protein [Stutzerimonas stutzeri]